MRLKYSLSASGQAMLRIWAMYTQRGFLFLTNTKTPNRLIVTQRERKEINEKAVEIVLV